MGYRIIHCRNDDNALKVYSLLLKMESDFDMTETFFSTVFESDAYYTKERM